MSGITPILDTLLHQVLGKRVDVPLARELPEPVRAVTPEEAVQPVRSDSRLDPRTPASAVSGASSRSGSGGAQVSLEAGPAEVASTRTHFSAAARTIADLLVRYPAPPTAIRPPAPLLPVDSDNPARLVRHLKASVDRSGLFYESHQAGWLRGEFSGTRLAREPQMTLTRTQPPAEAAPAERGSTDRPGAAVRLPLDSAAGDTLHGILRQQLEMLATPALRWEGEIWAGLFAALVIWESEQEPQREGPREGGESAPEEGPWRSRLTLRVEGLGEIHVDLGLCGDALELALHSGSAALAAHLDRAAGELRERLHALGVRQLQLKVEADR